MTPHTNGHGSSPECSAPTIKLLKESMGGSLCNFGLTNYFLDTTQNISSKRKNKQMNLGLNENKNFCASGNTPSRRKNTTHRTRQHSSKSYHQQKGLKPTPLLNSASRQAPRCYESSWSFSLAPFPVLILIITASHIPSLSHCLFSTVD